MTNNSKESKSTEKNKKIFLKTQNLVFEEIEFHL